METMLSDALKAADAEGVRGKDVTPYLLRALSERSAGETLKANIDLLKNNALVAAKIAAESSKQN
jgi:pseudouridine-5'-phosphate glycosidase